MKGISIPKEWEFVTDKIKQDLNTGIVIGKIDSGKSTLCKYLIHKWTALRIRVGYVDSDIGQSTLGPPTSVSLKLFSSPPSLNDYSNPTDMHFVGNTSPEGFLLQTLRAVKTMVDKSHQRRAEITLVDTTGFIEGPVARILKLHKIEMLRPEWIIALQTENEMEHLLMGYEKMGWQVIRLACSKQVITRSQAERQKYRNEKFKAYFKSAKTVNCSIHNVVFPSCILGTGHRIPPAELPKGIFVHGMNYLYVEKCGSELLIIADRMDASIPLHKLKKYFNVTLIMFVERLQIKDLLVGLNDRDNNTLGLGIIVDLDPSSGNLTLFTPVQDIRKVSTIHLGSVKVGQGRKECGKIKPIHYF